MLKKNTVLLEKDAINDNIYYLSFNYMSLSKFNIKIFFNACENIPEKEEAGRKNSNHKNENEIDILKEDLKAKNHDLIDININESDSKKNFK